MTDQKYGDWDIVEVAPDVMVTTSLNADGHLLPPTWSDGRAHVLDADCWCGPSDSGSSRPDGGALFVHRDEP